MNNSENEYDVILVGSGTCSATIAKELSKERKKVLILEQGREVTLKENFAGIAAIAQEVPVAKGMKSLRAVTTGGSTAIYFAVAKYPNLATFKSLGIDLSKELEEARKELPIAEIPEEFLGEQSFRLRQSAEELGYTFKKNSMLIDLSKCKSGYTYESKWKAKSFIEEAVSNGTTLINKAKVTKVIVEGNRAIGVEYKLSKGLGTQTCKAFGSKIVLGAGSLSTPKILRDSGVKNVIDRGFYCKPSFVMFGTVPDLKGKDGYVGNMGADNDDGIEIGDGTMSATLFQLLMLQNFKLAEVFSHTKTLTVGVTVDDSMSGLLDENGRYYKELTKEEMLKLKKGEERALKVLKNAGAKRFFKGGMVGGNPGGLVRIQDHVDEKLETNIKNLYVCDASVLPESMKSPPTLTLICLGKYLSKHLAK